MTISLLIIAMVGALSLMGHPLWCRCGSLKIWTTQARGSCTSQHLCDVWSTTHFEHGVMWYSLAWLLGVQTSDRIAAAVAAEAIFEIVENTHWVINRYRKATIHLHYVGDSIANSVGDALCCLAGAWVASVIPVAATIAVALAIELGLLLTIRDNLTINVLMLVRPIEAIRRWQSRNDAGCNERRDFLEAILTDPDRGRFFSEEQQQALKKELQQLQRR